MDCLSDAVGKLTSVFDLSIPQPTPAPRKLPAYREDREDREAREARCTRNLFTLLETRRELRGVYAPADQITETLRWSA
jgi:hypothetical protein